MASSLRLQQGLLWHASDALLEGSFGPFVSAGSSRWTAFGNVEGKLVIAAFVRPDEQGSDPKRGGPARALEVQDGSSIDERIAQGKPRTVPLLAAKVRLVGVARIMCVEAVGQNGGLRFVGKAVIVKGVCEM
jgi:hypothetical protein